MKNFVIFLLVISLVACVTHQEKEPPIRKEPVVKVNPNVEYIVQRNGESLATIALKQTGTAMNWRELAKANPRIKNYHLKQGDIILIPKRLLKKGGKAVIGKTKVSVPVRSEKKFQPSESLLEPMPEATPYVPTKYKATRNELIGELMLEDD